MGGVAVAVGLEAGKRFFHDAVEVAADAAEVFAIAAGVVGAAAVALGPHAVGHLREEVADAVLGSTEGDEGEGGECVLHGGG